jgi:hypothetical protein
MALGVMEEMQKLEERCRPEKKWLDIKSFHFSHISHLTAYNNIK